VAGVVEIRTYKLLPGTGGEFHRAVVDEVMPLLDRCGTKVVAFGPSLDDADLYPSSACTRAPREAIGSRIESSISVVIPAGELEPARRH
jgi:hypothetical protein